MSRFFKKTAAVLFSVSILLLFNPTSIYAVASNSVVTKVGNPASNPPLGSGNGSNAIVQSAYRITTLLYKAIGEFGLPLYDRKSDEAPDLYYWCQFLIIDAYNEAGYTGMSRANNFSYDSLVNFFSNTPGYQFLGPNTPVEQIKPGAVIFFGGGALYHVAIVASIDVDANGNGGIHTYESNNVVTSDVVSVSSHIATRAHSTAGLYGVTGFGQPTNL